jgi:hypothetical protein
MSSAFSPSLGGWRWAVKIVELVLEVGLPRPRSYELITSEPFTERKQLLLEHLGMTLPPGKAS